MLPVGPGHSASDHFRDLRSDTPRWQRLQGNAQAIRGPYPPVPLAPRALAIFAALAPLALAVPSASAIVDQPRSAPPAPAAVAPDGVIVQWAAGADRGEKAAARSAAEVTYAANLGDPDFQLVEVEPGQSPGAAVRALAEDPAVAVAERDSYRELDGTPTDPLFGQLWGLRNLGAGVGGFGGAVAGADANVPAAWDRTFGTPSTVVADIDSGYRFEFPDLGAVAWTNPGEIAGNGFDDDGNGYVDDVRGWDFVGANLSSPTPDNDPTDDNLISGGHGVHTAGTIGGAGDDGIGVTGVARNVRIMPLRVCSLVPASGETKCSASALIAAINYAGNEGARAANISLGSNTFTQAEVNAIAANPGTLYVISAGNDGGDNDGGQPAPKGHHYPCDYQPTVDASPAAPGAIENIICVAATDQADGLAAFSDWGATSVDIGAPGTEILSTYPKQEAWMADDFETDNFASTWLPYGAEPGFDRAGASDGPLTSFGMTDTPGGAPAASSVYGVLSAEASEPPAGTGACRIKGMRMRKGGSLSYGLFLDAGNGLTYDFISSETVGSAMVGFQTAPIYGLGGHELQMFFEYASDSTPTASEGFWGDNLRLDCYAPLNAGSAYSFLQGTSMAAPHVTGAAALLFSLEPEATVTEVRDALLQSAEPVASLAGKTTTGGRLDVAAALTELVPIGAETVAPDTVITASSGAGGASTEASFSFERAEADVGEFECRVDGAPTWASCTSPVQHTVGLGGHVFQVRAKVPSGLVDPTPASVSWTVTSPSQLPAPTPAPISMPEPAPAANPSAPVIAAGCTVPKLNGKALGQAKAALKAADCALGDVTKPKARKGRKAPKLVVKSSKPGPGATSTGNVSLKLGPKPSSK